MAAPFDRDPRLGEGAGGDVLALWVERTGRRREGVPGRGGLRFAFYGGGVSTEDWQDPVMSRARQREQAQALIIGRGVIVAEFFDAGQSRAAAWARASAAAALVAQLADPGRGWDAIVIGEYERAFYGAQYAAMAPLFEHYGVQLWMPEAGGRVDFASEQTMTVLGLSSKREVTRTSIRVRTAMAAQAREQGRYLGGRPPYGYRLADAGPHPNKAHAAWAGGPTGWNPTPRPRPWCGGCCPAAGRAQRRADLPRVERGGHPVPVGSRPGTQPAPHRRGVDTRHGRDHLVEFGNNTGRKAWNRQRTDTELADPANTSLGHKTVPRWNLPDGWLISARPAHRALVSEADFIAAQAVNAARDRAP